MDIQNLQANSSGIKMRESSSKTDFKAIKDVNSNEQTATNKRVDITTEILEFRMAIQIKTLNSFKEQGAFAAKSEDLTIDYLEKYEYDGKPITELTQEEAEELVEDDGFFSIKNTSNRIADFVIEQSGDDILRLKSGREGIMIGFEEAEAIWGNNLPDISYDTLNAVLEKIDEKIREMGGSIMDVTA